MASVVGRMDKAISKLDRSYTKGLVQYPRVANNYIETIRFFEHPHPPLQPFDEYATPLAHSEYPFTKELCALELTNAGISTPATLFYNVRNVDKYFDGNLQPRAGKAKELDYKLDCFYDHIETLISHYGESALGENGEPDVNILAKDGLVSQFVMDITPFQIMLHPSPERQKEVDSEQKKDIRDDILNLSPIIEEKKIKVKSLDEAHALFKKKRLLMKRLKEQREAQEKAVFMNKK